MNLEFLINNECLRIVPLLTTKEFIDLCKNVGLNSSNDELENYEKQKLFFPIARARMPWKSPWDKNGWTYTFDFSPDQARNWFSIGLLWEPIRRRFLPWNHFENQNGDTKYESYYSRFQIFHFFMLHTYGLIRIERQYFISSKFNPSTFCRRQRKYAFKYLSEFRKQFEYLSRLSFICQCISNMYYPHTQSDLRKINLRMQTDGWDWYKYRRELKPTSLNHQLGITRQELKSYQNQLSTQACSIDPLENWHDLTIFTSLDKRKYLKGEAALAQHFYAMEMMLRFFYEDQFNERLDAPYFSHLTDIPYNNGIKNERDALHFLEYTINRYNLNPQPRLVLVCEGETEEEQYPRIIKDILGYSLDILGIRIMNVKGVGQAVGDHTNDRHMALRRFIDYHHHRLTIVFLVLDNEGGALNTISKLTKSKSIHDKCRPVTYEEYTAVWNPNFEFQNFDDTEIAEALQQIANNQTFDALLVAASRRESNNGKRHDTISDLFLEKTGSSLSKKALNRVLIDNLIKKTKQSENPWKSDRPVLVVLRNIIKIASWHKLPNSSQERDSSHRHWFGPDNRNRIERFIEPYKR
jgi:hypothetical protein